MKTVNAKLGNMRKSVSWVVYPKGRDSSDTDIVIQSDKRIASFDPKTGKGMLSAACPSGAYFLHLNPVLGATPVTVPADLIAECVGAQPKSGDQIGPGIYVA